MVRAIVVVIVYAEFLWALAQFATQHHAAWFRGSVALGTGMFAAIGFGLTRNGLGVLNEQNLLRCATVGVFVLLTMVTYFAGGRVSHAHRRDAGLVPGIVLVVLAVGLGLIGSSIPGTPWF